jgi:hypothetical protein
MSDRKASQKLLSILHMVGHATTPDNAPRDYYTLLTRAKGTRQWQIHFGDYQKSVVEDERRDFKDGFSGLTYETKMIKSKDDQASINAAIARFNVI